jgi:hypothetical protein
MPFAAITWARGASSASCSHTVITALVSATQMPPLPTTLGTIKAAATPTAACATVRVADVGAAMDSRLSFLVIFFEPRVINPNGVRLEELGRLGKIDRPLHDPDGQVDDIFLRSV